MQTAPRANARHIIGSLFPFLAWPRLTRAIARDDLIAGFTVALLMIPQSLACAQLAGVPTHYGVTLVLDGVKKQVLDVIERTGLIAILREENGFSSERLAIEALLARLPELIPR